VNLQTGGAATVFLGAHLPHWWSQNEVSHRTYSIYEKRNPKQVVSRVLFPAQPWDRGGDDHSSSPTVTGWIQQPTREPRAGNPRTLSYLVLLRVGFAWLPMSPPGPVSSYLTVSPLPRTQAGEAVCFLLRFPPRHRDWELPSTLPCGARTFLPQRSSRRRRSSALLRILVLRPEKNLPERFYFSILNILCNTPLDGILSQLAQRIDCLLQLDPIIFEHLRR